MAALERIWVCDTITGNRLNVVPVKDFTWARGFNAGSAGMASIPVNDPGVQELDLGDLIQERNNTLVYEVGTTVVAAGIIQDTDYDKDTGTLQVPHKDLWSVWEDRLAVIAGAPQLQLSKFSLGPLSLGTIAKRVVQEMIAPGGWYNLPIAFPADVAGTALRSWDGYALPMGEDALKELMESDGGPDIDFAPRWGASGALEWVMRSAPSLATGNVWEYNLDAKKSGAYNVKAKSSTDDFANNAYAAGEGTEKNLKLRSNPVPVHTRPAAVAVTSYKGIKDLGVLAGLAVERSRVLSEPTRQYSMSIMKDGAPAVTGLALGDTVKMYTATDKWLPQGWSSHRLIKFSGSLATPKVALEFQPTGA